MSDREPFDTVGQVYLIYDEYRTLLLNKLYYGARLDKLKKHNAIMECLIAVGASGSGVAGIALWKSDPGQIAWGFISAASILLAVIKPFVKLGDRIENYGKLFGEYAKALSSLKTLVDDLQVRRMIVDEDIKSFGQIRNRVSELAALDDPNPNTAFVRALQKKVNEQIPIDRLWVPLEVDPVETRPRRRG